jgi:DNA-binding transcriptional ArsR family regulator
MESMISEPRERSRCVAVMRALADDTRWRIVCALIDSKKPMTGSELVKELGVSNYNISKHMRILREAEVVTVMRQGKFVYCALAKRNSPDGGEPQLKLNLGCVTISVGQGDKAE